MTKEQYIKMNRGINDSRDLPEEFLSKIYDEIKNEEIKLKVTTMKRGTKENIINDKQRELLFHVQKLRRFQEWELESDPCKSCGLYCFDLDLSFFLPSAYLKQKIDRVCHLQLFCSFLVLCPSRLPSAYLKQKR